MSKEPLPLITPDRLQSRGQVRKIFSGLARPAWARAIVSPYPDETTEPEEPALMEFVVMLGETYPRHFHFNAIGLAIGYELCRCGHLWGTNDNHSDARNVYAQMIFAGAFEANLPVARLFTDAGAGKIAKALDLPHDLTPGNLALVPGPRASRDARVIAMHHARRQASEQPSSLPAKVGIAGYLANLGALFAFHDHLACLATESDRPLHTNDGEAAS